MRKELVKYLASLAVADPKQTRVLESVNFTSRQGFNSMAFLTNMFRELGVVWNDDPARTKNTRIEICIEAFEFLEKETPLSEGRLPVGIEKAVLCLLDLAKDGGHEEGALATLNKEFLKDDIQVVKSLSGDYEFEYGILTDVGEPLLSEAELKMRNLEKGLRKLIRQVLSNAYPTEWIEKLGLSEERLERMRQRQEEDRRRGLTQPEHSLLDYSDLSDLITIIKKRWDYLVNWLEEKNETVLFLDTILPLRNKLAHHRRPKREDLMLAIGISSRLCERVAKGLISTR